MLKLRIFEASYDNRTDDDDDDGDFESDGCLEEDAGVVAVDEASGMVGEGVENAHGRPLLRVAFLGFCHERRTSSVGLLNEEENDDDGDSHPSTPQSLNRTPPKTRATVRRTLLEPKEGTLTSNCRLCCCIDKDRGRRIVFFPSCAGACLIIEPCKTNNYNSNNARIVRSLLATGMYMNITGRSFGVVRSPGYD